MSLLNPNVRREALRMAQLRAVETKDNEPGSYYAERGEWSRSGGAVFRPTPLETSRAEHHYYRQGHNHQYGIGKGRQSGGGQSGGAVAEGAIGVEGGAACCERKVGTGKSKQKFLLGKKHAERFLKSKFGKNLKGSGFLNDFVGAFLGSGKKQGRVDKADESVAMKMRQLGKNYADDLKTSKLGKDLKGSGFFNDFVSGFKSVVAPVASIAKNVLGVVPHPAAQIASAGLGVLGAGKKQSKAAEYREKEGMKKADVLRHHEKDYQTGKDKKDEAEAMKLEVSEKKGKKKRRAGAGAGDGRRKRNDIVKRIMKEKGLKLIAASKYVKEHNLYTKK